MTDASTIVAAEIRSFVERVERVEDEIRERNELKSDIYKEAKGRGLDVKALKRVVADRRKDSSEKQEFDTLYELYWDAAHKGVDNNTSIGHARVHAHEE
jgi:uncharacterized protein (UPF0335 family)